MTEYVHTSTWIERGARFGLATKGFSYILVAVIALRVAVEGSGQTESREGALKTLADEPFGWMLLALVALGFASYAVWQLVRAIFDRDDEGDGPKGIGKRLGQAGKALLYGTLAVITASLLFDSGGGGGGQSEDKATAVALEWPGGRWIVGGVGLAIIGAGAFNAYRALSGSFRENLREEQMSGAEQPWYIAFGVIGHFARAVVFVMIGVFVLRAAYEYDPDEAIGLDGALQKLAGEAYGAWLLGAVALGLGMYGLFCLVEAKYRDV
ncbi:MAG TPA: DUF1206 domain-containing protein [Gaiellaceae bacterium]|nr:DUF1206 domain-containing protein [Gaiellaceae bacterium]